MRIIGYKIRGELVIIEISRSIGKARQYISKVNSNRLVRLSKAVASVPDNIVYDLSYPEYDVVLGVNK